MAETSILKMGNEDIQGSITLASPEWLWLLPALFLAMFIWRTMANPQQPANLATGSNNFSNKVLHPLISLLPKTYSKTQTPSLHFLVQTIAITGLIVSLAGPIQIGDRLPDLPQERDIIFIVDTSISMTLRDYVLDGQRIDRMTLLKGVLDNFIQKFPGERIGIIIFGSAAYTFVPLTHDQDLLRRMLSRIEATMVGRFNNMGEAIALGIKQAKQQTEGKRHRILVMLTDADKPTGLIDPQTAAGLAFEEKIPLYTIAIGAETSNAEEKRVTGLIYEPVDNELLATISEHTGGRNYQAGDAQALEDAVNDISSNESNQRKLSPQYRQKSLHYWPLLFSASLILIVSLSTAVKD